MTASESLGRTRARIARGLIAADAVVIAGASALGYLLRDRLGEAGVVREFANEIPAAMAVLPLWLLTMYWVGAYRREYLNAGGDAFRRFVAGTAVGVLVLGFASFALELQLSRLYVLFLFTFSLVLGGLVRILLRAWLLRQHRRGALRQRVLLVGASEESVDLAHALKTAERAGYEVVGFVDDNGGTGREPVEGLPVLGTVARAADVARERGVGLVIASLASIDPGVLRDLRISLEGSHIDLAVAPSLFEVVPRRLTVETVANTPILHVDQVRLTGAKAFAKRGLDLVVAGGLLVLSTPLTILAAALVKLDDGGPVLFTQERVGKDGDPFTVLKFRTMTVDAEERLAEIEHLNEAGHAFFKVRQDPRVTRIGAFLRKWSLDELPQLWNVLRGDMSMVGPRPPIPAEVEKYEPWQLRRLRVRPGITGVWQTSGRSEVPFDEAVRLDLFYIENWSLGYDLFLLGKTVLAVLGRRGAY